LLYASLGFETLKMPGKRKKQMQQTMFPLIEVEISVNGGQITKAIGNWDNGEETGILWSVGVPEKEEEMMTARYAAASTLFGLCETWQDILDFKSMFDERADTSSHSSPIPF